MPTAPPGRLALALLKRLLAWTGSVFTGSGAPAAPLSLAAAASPGHRLSGLAVLEGYGVSVPPEPLNAVELALFGVEDVNDDIQII